MTRRKISGMQVLAAVALLLMAGVLFLFASGLLSTSSGAFPPMSQSFDKANYSVGDVVTGTVKIQDFRSHFANDPGMQGTVGFKLADIMVDGVSLINNPSNSSVSVSWHYLSAPGISSPSGYSSCQYYCFAQSDNVPGPGIVQFTIRGLSGGAHTVTSKFAETFIYNTRWGCDGQGYSCPSISASPWGGGSPGVVLTDNVQVVTPVIACGSDTMACSDGSIVHRNAQNGCAFDACPVGAAPTQNQSCLSITGCPAGGSQIPAGSSGSSQQSDNTILYVGGGAVLVAIILLAIALGRKK